MKRIITVLPSIAGFFLLAAGVHLAADVERHRLESGMRGHVKQLAFTRASRLGCWGGDRNEWP